MNGSTNNSRYYALAKLSREMSHVTASSRFFIREQEEAVSPEIDEDIPQRGVYGPLGDDTVSKASSGNLLRKTWIQQQ